MTLFKFVLFCLRWTLN